MCNIFYVIGGTFPGKNAFYCCLRRYRGLKSCGFGVTEKEVSYLPFQLNMVFRELSQSSPPREEGRTSPKAGSGGSNSIFLVITAKRISSVYKSEYVFLKINLSEKICYFKTMYN